MAKIITLTFSPSIDKSATVSALVADKKMRCYSQNIEPGGGGINVARVINRLGGEVCAVFPSGGYTGEYFNDLLAQEVVPFTAIQSRNNTKENFVIYDETSKQEFRFGMPSSKLFMDEIENCLNTISSHQNFDFLVVSGSLPDGVSVDVFAKLYEIANKANAKFIVDTSGEALLQAVKHGVYLLKPNLEEMKLLLNRDDLQFEHIEMAARQLIKESNCKIIVVSLGADGAMLITEEESHTIKPPKVVVKSTVGAGDSMVAGIVFGLSQQLSLEDCLAYGIACGTATTTNLGSSLCTLQEVQDLLKSIKKN